SRRHERLRKNMRPRFSAVTADISTKNLQRCAYRHSLQHAAKQNAIPRFPVRIARINKSGKNAEIYRAHHIKRGLKGEGGSSVSPSPAFDASTIRHQRLARDALRPRSAN
ncbi:hypothetical protein, partial [Ralstonia solanacearum]